ncbi:CDP-glycerol glycerophosphotransferase family protein [Cytobacillus gottheilii]|uniref:CDP-glycerol glycerophosphotransferase family protein n=1 Tax=Cytobacillus gottheilii TaxID=859144 RepID=UPI0009BC7340|nr:CDP-glycerol glycerophosphotransferase family protein [Cytobacillus gottheilii]
MKKIFLFGASKLGELAVDKLLSHYDIKGFIDNDPNKQGTLLLDKKVYGIEILENFQDWEVIISSVYDIEIAKQLIDHGINKFVVFELIEDDYCLNFYDYSQVDNFNINHKKVCLLVENNSGSNTFALSKNIEESNMEQVDIITIDKSKKNNNYYYDILTSFVIITTHDYRCNDKQINIQLWHGVPLKGLSYMSKYENQNVEANHFAWSKFDHIISYSQTYSTLLNACYGVEGKKYEVLGMPRNDLLFDFFESRRNLEGILDQSLEGKKVIFFLPTFRKTIYGEKNGRIDRDQDFFDIENLHEINSFLRINNIILVAKPHPQERKNLSELSNIYILNEETLNNRNIDLYEILGAADTLITDYSSVFFDYLLLDKPIIFYTPDYEEYISDRGLLLEPFDFWSPGKKCNNIKELKEAILQTSENDLFSKERRQVLNILHRYKDPYSSRRLWDFIKKLITN